jgi:hypothetical protein
VEGARDDARDQRRLHEQQKRGREPEDRIGGDEPAG